MPLKIQKDEAFPFFHSFSFVSWCFICNLMSAYNLQLSAQILPSIFTLCNTSFNANIKHLKLGRIIEIAQFIFHSSYMHSYFILSKEVKTWHKAESTAFLIHILMWDTPRNTLYYWYVREDERKRNYGHSYLSLSLSFCVIISSTSCWLIQGNNVSKKGQPRMPGHRHFRMLLPVFNANSGWKDSVKNWAPSDHA